MLMFYTAFHSCRCCVRDTRDGEAEQVQHPMANYKIYNSYLRGGDT